jgi:type I restriction enzyme S subunit
MSEWREYNLSDVIEIIGGGTPKTKISEYWGGSIPWLSVVDFGDGNKRVWKTEKTITELGLKNSSTKILKKGQVIISARGTVGELAVLGRDMAFNQSCYGLNAIEGIATNDFLYYLLKLKVDELKRNSHGAVFDTITRNTFATITVNIPDLPTQKAIAEILSSLDDKIELNNQINQNLEALAQALFKQWFVDFEFPNENGEPYKSSGGEMVDSELGEIPKGWVPQPIGDLFEFVVGGDWGNDFIDEEHREKCYVVRGTDIPQLRNGSIGSTPIRFIKEKKAISRFLKPGDLVIEISGGSKDQPTGRTILITQELLDRLDNSAIPASFCRLIRPKQGFSEFLGVYFDKIYSEGKTWEYQNQSTGIANFQFKYFEEKEVLALPNDPLIIEAFNELVDPIISRISSNENLDLVKLRDTLLPKLISGDLEINESLLEPTF